MRFKQKLARAISRRCTIELATTRQLHKTNAEEFFATLKAKDNKLNFFSGDHLICKESSLTCPGREKADGSSHIIVLPQVLSTTRLVLITTCIDQNLSTIRFAVANYLRLLTHCSLNNYLSPARLGLYLATRTDLSLYRPKSSAICIS